MAFRSSMDYQDEGTDTCTWSSLVAWNTHIEVGQVMFTMQPASPLAHYIYGSGHSVHGVNCMSDQLKEKSVRC